jgi:predicted GIY-YIG superfamily endonuclease
MDEIGAHFEKMGNKFKRLVYVYEFPDNHAYVGLTFSEKKRQKEHQNLQNAKSAVAKHILQTNSKPNYKTITEYIDSQEASNLEKCIIDSYKNNGWIMLNKIKGGGLGGRRRTDLTMEIIKELTQGFKSRSEFKKQYSKEYSIARTYGWLEHIFSEIPVLDRTIWTYDKTKEESKKYNSRFEFNKGNNTAYQNARKNGWLDEFFLKQYGVNLPEIKQP